VLEEDSRLQDNTTTILPSIEEESNQSFNEQDMLDQNGKYMIFAPENESLISPLNLEPTSHIEQDAQKQSSSADQLDPKFSMLNYVNKIQILLKALMIEKEQNKETDSRLTQLKKELKARDAALNSIRAENDELIGRVAQSESAFEQKDEHIQLLTKKKLDYKFMIEQLKDKTRSMEEILEKSEQNKIDEVKQMEQRIELRVAKIIQQKESMMKQEKAMILEKYKQYDRKIKDQRK